MDAKTIHAISFGSGWTREVADRWMSANEIGYKEIIETDGGIQYVVNPFNPSMGALKTNILGDGIEGIVFESATRPAPDTKDDTQRIKKDQVVVKDIKAEFAIEKAENGRPIIISRISNDRVDDQGHMVNQKGVVLERFQKNPVVLHQHDPEQRVGKNVWLRKKKEGDRQSLFAATEMYDNDLANNLLDWMGAGMPLAMSIGIFVNKYHRPEPDEIKERPELADAWAILDEWTLAEYSFVTIPANEDALALAVRKGLNPKTIKALGVTHCDFDLLDEYMPQRVVAIGRKRWVNPIGEVK